MGKRCAGGAHLVHIAEQGAGLLGANDTALLEPFAKDIAQDRHVPQKGLFHLEQLCEGGSGEGGSDSIKRAADVKSLRG